MILSKIIFIFLLFFSFCTLFAFFPLTFIPSITISSDAAMTIPVSITITPIPSTIPNVSPVPSQSILITPTVAITPLPSLSPTEIPTPKPTSAIMPTVKPTEISVTKAVIVQPNASSSMDAIATEIFNAVNDFRKSQGLHPVQSNSITCSFAHTRVEEIINDFNHDGFQNRINTHSLPYGNYSLVVENIAMNSNSQKVVSNWINSPGHAANMLADTPYGCVGNTGNYYVYEGYKP